MGRTTLGCSAWTDASAAGNISGSVITPVSVIGSSRYSPVALKSAIVQSVEVFGRVPYQVGRPTRDNIHHGFKANSIEATLSTRAGGSADDHKPLQSG